MPEGDFHPSDHARSRAHLLTAFGRRDAPSPASGRWPAIPGLGHESLPSAGSRPRLIICRAFGAQPVTCVMSREAAAHA